MTSKSMKMVRSDVIPTVIQEYLCKLQWKHLDLRGASSHLKNEKCIVSWVEEIKIKT